jgi:hypothetical protein
LANIVTDEFYEFSREEFFRYEMSCRPFIFQRAANNKFQEGRGVGRIPKAPTRKYARQLLFDLPFQWGAIRPAHHPSIMG